MYRCYDCGKASKDVRSRQCDYFLCDTCQQARDSKSRSTYKSSKAKPRSSSCPPSPIKTSESLTVGQAADAVFSTEMGVIKKMNRSKLTAAMYTDVSCIRASISAILPASADTTEVANHALTVHNKLKRYTQSRISEIDEAELTTCTLSQSIFNCAMLDNPESTSRSTTSTDSSNHIQLCASVQSGAKVATPQQDTAVKVTASKITCVMDCRFQHQEKGKPIDCSMCANQFHRVCVEIKSTSRPSFWICPSCKDIPKTVRDLKELVTRLSKENQALKSTMESQAAIISSLQETHIHSTQESGVPTALSTEPREKPAPASPYSSEKATPITPEFDTLIIGDSIIRDLNEKGLCRTKVECLRGADVCNVRESLEQIDVGNFDTVVIHVGTNDCTSTRKQETAEKNLNNLVDSVQQRAPNTAIVLSSVCPRVDDHGRHQITVNKMNRHIRSLADSKGCLIVDHDKNFKVDNSADPSLLNSRGLHLNRTGTRQLLRNINNAHRIVKVKEDKESRHNSEAYTPVRHRRSFSRMGPYTDHSRPVTNLRCHKCGLANHTTRDCHHSKPVRCNDCHEYGHKAYNGSRPFLCQGSFQDSFLRHNWNTDFNHGHVNHNFRR